MKLVDKLSLNCQDAVEDFEGKKHYREPEVGEFFGKNTNAKQSTTKNTEKSESEISKGIQCIRQKFNEGVITPTQALRLAAQLLKGTYYSDTEGLKGLPLRLGRDFLNETGKYVNKPEVLSGKISAKEIVNRQLFAYEHLEYLLKNSKLVNEWQHSETHHPERDFIVLIGRIDKGNGKISRYYTLDIFRRHKPGSMNRSTKRGMLYNISSEGFPGAEKKWKHLKLDDSDLSYGNVDSAKEKLVARSDCATEPGSTS